MDTQPEVLAESGAVTLPDTRWAEARRRAAIIGPLADSPNVSRHEADAAALALGLTERTVYRLIRAWRRTGGKVPALVAPPPSGGRGRKRLSAPIETIIQDVLNQHYLTRQKLKMAAAVKEVRRRCRLSDLKPPAFNTVKARIAQLMPDRAVAKREGGKAATRLKPAAGSTPPTTAPLDVFQIDHTKIDVIIVDPVSRQPIGRPHLTVAIDEYSRSIVGICVTLEAPSATSVGLCLTHAVTEKGPWLERLGAECAWPMRGKPRRIYVDNGADFHSEGLRRGCEVHGIKLDYRPPGRPHFGGIVERVIGTTMRMIHELPGTTFANIKERGTYDADAKAALTLAELEKWIALAICGPYHSEWHSTLQQTPAAKWAGGVAQGSPLSTTQNPQAFLIDFLPVVKRNVQRCGFVIDRIAYYSSALSPWIASRDRQRKYVIRTDPRDLSRIWVLDPERNIYIEVPFRTLSNPPITKWEHRAAVARLREQGRATVDEAAIFKAVEQMRAVVDEATTKTRSARRSQARRSHLKDAAPPAEIAPPATSTDAAGDVAKPFDDIEEW